MLYVKPCAVTGNRTWFDEKCIFKYLKKFFSWAESREYTSCRCIIIVGYNWNACDWEDWLQRPVSCPWLKKKKKKSLWKWPDVTLPQCLPPHNSAAAWGEPDTLSGPEYRKNIEKKSEKIIKQAILVSRERGAAAWALPRWVCAPVRDGRLPGLHVKLTNAVLETFWWVNCSFFFSLRPHNVAARPGVCMCVFYTTLRALDQLATHADWHIDVRDTWIVVNVLLPSCDRTLRNFASFFWQRGGDLAI